jgi:ribonuclease T2
LFRSSLAALLLLAACGSEATPAGLACNIPEQLDLPAAPTPPDGEPDPPTAGYVLALSWSPEFCRFRKDSPGDAGQCSENRFGFVVHGLWPVGPAYEDPRACAAAAPITERVAREHYCMMPSTDLMQHQWAAHGTCAFKTAEAYFTATRHLWQRVKKPNLKRLDPNGLTAGDVRRAFTDLNPGLEPVDIFIESNRRGWLQEVRICLDAETAYRPCRDGVGVPDDGAILVWRGG